ncbi:Hsp20/alpha crystallin family protein [Chitinimonas sp.]|uniref:Hsp20/alpha crystallin family protein n=1 Tax=Chitinimonas sp. TaxID=1934313 RepID=UPI002F933DD9
MSNLTVNDPLTSRMNRLLQNFWHPAGAELFRNELLRPEGALDMKLDISQDEGNYIIRADIPGVNKEDIHVDVDGSLVSISAEVKKETEERKGEAVLYTERYQGKVFRSFRLDSDVDQGKAQAQYKNGVLELKLPKLAKVSNRRIAVS